jgi:Peptide-N-glycosidase F, C terminal
MHSRLLWLIMIALVAILGASIVGCGDDDDDDDNDDGAPSDDDDDSEGDDDDNDSDDDDDDVAPPNTFTCDGAGYEVRTFENGPDDKSLYALAADFTVATTKGDWTLSEMWTGCESYLFIQNRPAQNSGWPDELWTRVNDVRALVSTLPENSHLFFVVDSSDEASRLEKLVALEETVDGAIASMTDDEKDRWWHRVHYVTEAAKEMQGYLGDLMKSPRWGFGIDRLQRVRYIGSYADPGRYDSSQGWFGPNLAMVANEAVAYNFEAERDSRLEAQDATIVELFAGDVISGGRGSVDVTLPDALIMETFDTMEFDLYLGCVGDGEYGDCPPWDYLVYLWLCDEGDPLTCSTEVGRWITTYHREGRWVHDVSALLPLVANGGLRRFEFDTSQAYEVYLTIRLSSSSKGVRPVEIEYLFTGGAFGPDYNDAYTPIDVVIPGDAVKVELATVITGHGGVQPENCAEFCNTSHHFYVNGAEYMRDFPEASSRWDCRDKVAEGTVPNQYGTWWYGRSGWCPGKDVPLVMTDITADVVLDDTNTFDYEGFYDGAPYHSTGANIRMRSWVVVSK